MRRVDWWWFRVLGAVLRWVMRRYQGFCRWELQRRLWRHVAWQKPHLN